jgi:hypothetical protein
MEEKDDIRAFACAAWNNALEHVRVEIAKLAREITEAQTPPKSADEVGGAFEVIDKLLRRLDKLS